jgi:hypothetical protein
MPDTVKLPVVGSMSKNKLLFGVVAAGGVTAYLLWRHAKQSQQAAASAYGYGATAYGYGTPAGYYGYGYGYGTAMGGGVTPYPMGSEYGYGAYGYGYYNPYTGQWLGPGPTPTPIPTPTPGPKPKPPKPGTHTITADGHSDLAQIAGRNHTTRWQIVAWNPHLAYLLNTRKPVPRGTRVKV